MKMIFHADSNQTYRCGDYGIYWGTRGWTVYNYAKRKACLGKDLTISQAMAVAEKDRALQT